MFFVSQRRQDELRRLAELDITVRLLLAEVESKLGKLDFLKKYALKPHAPQNVRDWYEANRERFQKIDDLNTYAMNSLHNPGNASTWARLSDSIQEVIDHFYSQFLPPDLNYRLDTLTLRS